MRAGHEFDREVFGDIPFLGIPRQDLGGAFRAAPIGRKVPFGIFQHVLVDGIAAACSERRIHTREGRVGSHVLARRVWLSYWTLTPQAVRTALRNGRSVKAIAGSHRSLSARARSGTMCCPVSGFQRAPQRFIRISNRLLQVASTLPLPSAKPSRRARA